MGLFLRVMLSLAVLPGFALALDLAPAEEPPPDFAARQYIDSRGCVFRRDASDRWQARVTSDGAPICGYPPTRSMRGLNGRPRLVALDPDAGLSRAGRLERDLSATVITNLRPGELLGDPRPSEKLPDLGPEPASDAPAAALRAALAAAPSVRQGMAGTLQPNRRLCELLGYDGKAGGSTGRDPSQGYCAALPESDLARLSFARPLGSVQADHGPASQPSAPVAQRAAPDRVALPSANRKTPQPPARLVTGGGGERQAAAGMIPATARYVHLGRFPDPDEAARAVRRVAGLGYPVLRAKGDSTPGTGQAILAGPFHDRETIVRALDAIRRAGFAGAVVR